MRKTLVILLITPVMSLWPTSAGASTCEDTGGWVGEMCRRVANDPDREVVRILENVGRLVNETHEEALEICYGLMNPCVIPPAP